MRFKDCPFGQMRLTLGFVGDALAYRDINLALPALLNVREGRQNLFLAVGLSFYALRCSQIDDRERRSGIAA
jgi:hypothetical protein